MKSTLHTGKSTVLGAAASTIACSILAHKVSQMQAHMRFVEDA
jgi:hypothetical protein